MLDQRLDQAAGEETMMMVMDIMMRSNVVAGQMEGRRREGKSIWVLIVVVGVSSSMSSGP